MPTFCMPADWWRIETPAEFNVFYFGYDVMESSMEKMREVDPCFELPQDFYH